MGVRHKAGENFSPAFMIKRIRVPGARNALPNGRAEPIARYS
jgi:hypothetical protein